MYKQCKIVMFIFCDMEGQILKGSRTVNFLRKILLIDELNIDFCAKFHRSKLVKRSQETLI